MLLKDDSKQSISTIYSYLFCTIAKGKKVAKDDHFCSIIALEKGYKSLNDPFKEDYYTMPSLSAHHKKVYNFSVFSMYPFRILDKLETELTIFLLVERKFKVLSISSPLG